MNSLMSALKRHAPPVSMRDPDARAEAAFWASYPEYATTRAIDTLRASEYHRFDQQGHTYLDYTGGGVYAESQLRAHADLLSHGIFGNPHSGNPASLSMTALVDRTRAAVLEYFHAPSDEYDVVFTPNATGALKLVGESYPFASDGRYLLTVDNHNSVNGIREFARRRGAEVAYAPISASDLRLDAPRLFELLDQASPGHKLFAFPAQSNFSGVQHPLSWVSAAKRRGWDVLLDAAAFVPSNRLDLRHYQPDFVAVSFYKMFGYPTGTGALIVRKAALARLERPWFAGGTITFSSVRAAAFEGDGYYRTPGAAGFEDGTINYLSLPAVEVGLRWIEKIGIDTIHTRVLTLTDWLLAHLAQLKHANGRPVVQLYGPRDTRDRGATVALNFVDPAGIVWDCWQVETLANQRKLSLRAGCHCNPGAREVALDVPQAQLAACFENKDQLSYAEYLPLIKDSVRGVVRVSLGLASTFHDVFRFTQFASEFADRRAGQEGG
jgi:molybdenum cofactor sulfurtransferase